MRIGCVLRRFPERATAVLALAEADTSFLLLCEDYELCLDAANRFEHSAAEHTRTAAEYRQVTIDLEAEISAALRRNRLPPR
jgi:hypothetical protein